MRENQKSWIVIVLVVWWLYHFHWFNITTSFRKYDYCFNEVLDKPIISFSVHLRWLLLIVVMWVILASCFNYYYKEHDICKGLFPSFLVWFPVQHEVTVSRMASVSHVPLSISIHLNGDISTCPVEAPWEYSLACSFSTDYLSYFQDIHTEDAQMTV